MSLLKTVLTKTIVGFTAKQFVQIQDTFVRESAASNRRMQEQFKKEEDLKLKALARAERAEQLLYELEEKTLEDEEQQIQKSIEQNEKDALKQFEFEEVRVVIIHFLTENHLYTLQLKIFAARNLHEFVKYSI